MHRRRFWAERDRVGAEPPIGAVGDDDDRAHVATGVVRQSMVERLADVGRVVLGPVALEKTLPRRASCARADPDNVMLRELSSSTTVPPATSSNVSRTKVS